MGLGGILEMVNVYISTKKKVVRINKEIKTPKKEKLVIIKKEIKPRK